jgi:DUF1009 family protein
MVEVGARVLAVEAARTLLLDRAAFLSAADERGLAVFGLEPGVGRGAS